MLISKLSLGIYPGLSSASEVHCTEIGCYWEQMVTFLRRGMKAKYGLWPGYTLASVEVKTNLCINTARG